MDCNTLRCIELHWDTRQPTLQEINGKWRPATMSRIARKHQQSPPFRAWNRLRTNPTLVWTSTPHFFQRFLKDFKGAFGLWPTVNRALATVPHAFFRLIFQTWPNHAEQRRALFPAPFCRQLLQVEARNRGNTTGWLMHFQSFTRKVTRSRIDPVIYCFTSQLLDMACFFRDDVKTDHGNSSVTQNFTI